MSDLPNTKTKAAIGKLLGIWWISWFGFIGGFVMVGVTEYRRELEQGSSAAHLTLAALTGISLCWVAFYTATWKFDKKWQAVWRLFTLLGTVLALITVVGIYFFTGIATRLQ